MNKRLKRITTAVFSVLFVISTVLGTLPSFAASDKTAKVEITSTNTKAFSTGAMFENVLKGKSAIIKYTNTNTGKINVAQTRDNTKLTDGDLNADFYTGTDNNYNKPGSNTESYYDGSVYTDVYYNLGESTKIGSFWLCNHNGVGQRTGIYKVYAADTEEDLYKDENLMANVDNVANAHQVQGFTVKFGEEIKAQFIGIRVFKPCTDYTKITSQDNQDYFRMNEIAVFVPREFPANKGVLSSTTVEDTATEFTAPECGAGEYNLIKGKTPTLYNNSGAGDVQTSAGNNKVEKLTDGDLTVTEHAELGAEPRFYTGKGTTEEPYVLQVGNFSQSIVFDLGGNTEISKFYVAKTKAYGTRMSEYVIFAGNDKNKLFESSNALYFRKSDESQNPMDTITFATPVKAKYFGIIVLNPWTSTATGAEIRQVYARLVEIQLIGKMLAPDAPTASDYTHNSVTLDAHDGFEYSNGGDTWQDSNVFSGLTPKTQYKFYQRVKASGGIPASDKSPVLEITTKRDPSDVDVSLSSDDVNALPEVDAKYKLLTKGMDPISDYTNKEGWLQSTSAVGNSNHLTDGIVQAAGQPENEWRTSVAKFAYNDGGTIKYVGQGVTEGRVYHDIYFDFEGPADIDKVVLIQKYNDKNLTMAKYNLYLGNDQSTLFSVPFSEVDNSENKHVRQIFDISKANGGTPMKAQYVGIRVFDPTCSHGAGYSSDPNNCYVRMQEFAVYGSPAPIVAKRVIADGNAALPEDWGTNLIAGKSWFEGVGYFGDPGNYGTAGPSKNGSCLTDGDLSVDAEFSGFKFASESASPQEHSTNAVDKEKSYWVDITFNLHNPAYIDGLMLVNHANAQMRTRHFEIYVSDLPDTLYEESHKILENKANMDGNGKYRRFGWNFKGLLEDGDTTFGNERIVGEYVGLRIYAPTAPMGSHDQLIVKQRDDGGWQNNLYVRLNEFAIYGSYVDPDFEFKDKFEVIDKKITPEQLAAYGKSLIHGTKPNSVSFNGKSQPKHDTETDGDPETKIDYNNASPWNDDGSMFLNLVWEFQDPTLIDAATYIGESINGYHTGWYRIYASEDEDLLFDEESMLFEYNCIKATGADTACLGQHVTFNKPKPVYFVALQIVYPVTTAGSSVYPRIKEFCVYGKTTERDKTPSNLATNLPVTAYTKTSSGKIKDVTSKNFTRVEHNYIADDNTKTTAEITTNKEKLELLFNLCQEAEISSICVKSTSGQKLNYNVYASNDLNKIWNDSSKLYSYKGSSSAYTKKFSKAKTMRYVRVEILNSASSIKIADISINGPKYMQLRSKNLAKNIQDTSFAIYTQDKKTGDNAPLSQYSAKKLHDGSDYSTVGITAGTPHKKTVNILFDLEDFKTINRVKINFPNGSRRYLPTETKIYVSESSVNIDSLDAKPVATFKGLPTQSKNELSTTLDMIPTFGQYVRVEFCDGGDSDGLFKEMVIALSEIKAYGTSVVGMSQGSDDVVSFEDKDLGLKWGIVRQCKNDIFTDVVSSTVTMSTSTNWQKQSLNKTPFMMIMDKYKGAYKKSRNYTFKFFDAAGNEVTNFGERMVEVSFKMHDGMTSSTSMAAYTGNKWYAQPYDIEEHYPGYVTMYEPEKRTTYAYSALSIISSNDKYWKNIGPLEDYGDEEPQYAPATELDKETSTSAIITEDKDFYIKPKGALRLHNNCQLIVEVTTGEIPGNVYSAVEAIDNPEYIAATYNLQLLQDEYDYAFDGKIKTKLHIPADIKGYFSGYKLAKLSADGTAAEFVKFTKDGDYLYFDTDSVGEYALIGSKYYANGDAPDSDIFNEDGSPITGETSNAIFFLNLALISLAVIILINTKKFKKVR